MTISSRKFFNHCLILTVNVLFAFFWNRNHLLADYNLQLVAFLVILYFGYSLACRQAGFLVKKTAIDMAALSLLTFILVFATGSLSSPLFFLLYFLLFGLSLLFEPGSSLFLVFLLTILFLIIPAKQDTLHELLQLASLFAIVPLAVIFGKQYIKLRRDELEIKALETEEKKFSQKIEEQEKEIKSLKNAQR